MLPGSFPVHDLPDLGISLPEGPYATIAGLVLDRLGRLPDKGAAVEVGGWRLEVLDVDRRAITWCAWSPYPTRPRMHLPDNRPKNWCERGRDRKIYEPPNVSR